MNNSRRNFLQQMAMLLPMSQLAANKLYASEMRHHSIMDKLGLHLACVQDELVARPQQTIEFIQSTGIKHLELPDPLLLKRLYPILNGMGFHLHACHFASPYITNNWQPYIVFGNTKPSRLDDFQKVIEEATKYNVSYLVFPDIFPEDRGGLKWYEEFSVKLNIAGKACQENGIQLCYHNHSFEFQPTENTSPIEVMLNTLNPALVKLELDLFWMALAGINIPEFLNQYKDQIALLHLGDVSADTPQIYRSVTLPQESYQAIGKGKVDFTCLQNENLTEDIPYYFINLQKSESIFEDINSSIAYLKSL